MTESPIFRAIIFHFLALFAVMFNISEISISGIGKALPLFDLMIIFYFTVFKNYFSIWFIFLLGIWCDALSGDPIGLTALCYILLIKFFATINDNMMIRENFRQILQQFSAFCFLFLLMKWSMLSALNQTAYSVVNPLVELLLSSVFYVVVHKLLNFLESKFSSLDQFN